MHRCTLPPPLQRPSCKAAIASPSVPSPAGGGWAHEYRALLFFKGALLRDGHGKIPTSTIPYATPKSLAPNQPLILLAAVDDVVDVDRLVLDLVQNQVPLFNRHLVILVGGNKGRLICMAAPPYSNILSIL